MTEGKSRFKIKKGEVEIEYEGDSKEVETKYKEALIWISSTPEAPSIVKSTKEAPKKEKVSRRGGRRSSVISPAIDKLMEEKWFSEFKKEKDVVKELNRRGVPGANERNIGEALKRRVQAGKLDRIRDKDGRWTYRTKSE